MAFAVFERWSPEHALNNTIDDIKESGLDGLKKHLTSNALKTVENAEAVSGNLGIAMITTYVVGGNAMSVLLDKLSECDWTVKEVMKGSETSKAVVGFNYQDKMTGTIELTMVREEKVWKIDKLSSPKFDKVSVGQGKKQSSES